jgi:hypothetical protein
LHTAPTRLTLERGAFHRSPTQIAWLTNPAGNVVYPTTTSIISAVNDGGGLSSSILLLGTWVEYNVQRTLRAKKKNKK